jgi:hypothetical protein
MPNQLVIAQTVDASALISIGLDGFLTGATSTGLSGGDEADTDRAVAKLIRDSVAMELIRRVNLSAFVHVALRQLSTVNEFRACFPDCVTPNAFEGAFAIEMSAAANGIEDHVS